MAAAAVAASSAAAATRAALVRLALLLLIQQLQPVVANVRDIPEAVKKDNSEALQNSRFTTTTPEPHNQHHSHSSGHGHRGVHPGARLNGAQLASSKKLIVESPESPMDRKVHDEGGPNIRKPQDDLSDMLQPLEITNNKSISGDHHLAPPIITTDIVPPPSSSVASNHHANHTSGCSTCRIRQELRNMSLLAIKEQILNKLGMKHAPNITGRTIPKIPPLHHLLDLYGMQGDQPDRFFQPGPMVYEEDDDFHAKTTMVIAVAQTSKLRHGGGIGTDLDIQHFRFSEHSTRNKVSDASMFIWVPEMSRPVRVRVYRVVGNATEHQSMMVLLAASSKLGEQRKPGWVELDARKLLTDWFKSPHDNLGVVVKLEESNGLLIPYSTDSYDHGEDTKQPFVRVFTTDGRKHRSKRTIGLNCHENSQETRCCRYPLTVDFEEFGWDWIIAPKKYDANYCSGECPYVFLQKYPHTHIVQQANPQGTAGPCCAPRKMSPISMLYFDNEFNIIYGLLPGMVVDRCGCQ